MFGLLLRHFFAAMIGLCLLSLPVWSGEYAFAQPDTYIYEQQPIVQSDIYTMAQPQAAAQSYLPVANVAVNTYRSQSDDPRRWLTQPVSFDVKHYPLPKLLHEFAVRQGVAAQVSEQLKDGTVTGSFSFVNPAQFLDLIGAAQHMNWYYDGGMAHFFSEAEMTSKLLSLEGWHEEALRRNLADLGLYDSRFTWRLADNGRLLMVQGPQVYIDHVTEVLGRQVEAEAVAVAAAESVQAAQAAEPAKKKLGVFRLKHAWAAERTITSGNADATVPGVADLLRQILSGNVAEANSRAAAGSTASGTPRRMKGSGVVARENAEPAPVAAVPDSVPFIQADSRMNAVLVWDDEENLARYKEIVETLDQPLELIEIRAAIVDVETDRSRELGVTWEYKGDNDKWKNNAGSNVGSGNNRVTYESIAGDGFQYATIFTKGLDQFMARVSAIAKTGGANILSRPSVLTQDNIQATLEHTETFYVRLEGEREVDLADITTGLTLRVTPHVVQEEDGSYAIQLAVYIVNGSDTYDDNDRVDNLPRVRQSTITTQAVVMEGEALVIGGYYNEMRSTQETGVPGLRRIPGLGALFRSRSANGSKSERLFVLSPRLVRPGESPIVEGTEAQRSMNTSPAKKLLDGPAAKDPAPPDKKKRKERRRRND